MPNTTIRLAVSTQDTDVKTDTQTDGWTQKLQILQKRRAVKLLRQNRRLFRGHVHGADSRRRFAVCVSGFRAEKKDIL